MKAVCFVVVLILAAACSGSGGGVTTGDTERPPEDGVVGIDTADVVLADLPAPGEDSRAVDTVTPDLMKPEDVAPDVGPACDPGEGCFLDPCSEHSDCQSGWCVQHMGDKVCTVSCETECPAGFSCSQVSTGGPDLVFVCVSLHANLCKPCATGADCKAVGGAEDVCVDYGDEGSFCGGGCGEDGDCPWGFSCVDTVTVDAIETTQCVADAGVCPCTDTSAALALWTPCEVVSDFGTCQGKRICSNEGLTECDAAIPGEEICNGLDDDCDGDTDEPLEVGGDYVNLCDDENPCTQDVCEGESGCTNQALDSGECVDGNPCTVADHCVAGQCMGTPVDCDDQNPCTDDTCNEEGGCSYEFNAADCDDGDPCTVADECAEGACAGFPVNCDCTEDADCAALEDGDVCNGTLVCDLGQLPYQCVVDPDTAVDCPQPQGVNAPCLVVSCDPGTGVCSTSPANEGMVCDIGDPCAMAAHCQEGECVPGEAVNCADDNPCTDDSCEPGVGCVHLNSSGPCNDGNACTLNDVCSGGACTGGQPDPSREGFRAD